MADVIKAAGGLIWREDAGVRKLAVIHRERHDDWTLPKGKLEPNEDWTEAAVREVREETGCDVRMEEFAGEVRYAVNGTPKIVRFWNMSLAGPCDFRPSEEVDELVWMSVPDALQRLDYEGERKLILQSHGKQASD